MEIEQFLINYLDKIVEDAIIDPDNNSVLPIGRLIREELLTEGVEISRETLKERCRHKIYKNGKQEWILDGEKILVRLNPDFLLKEGAAFTKPFRDSKIIA